MSDRFYYGQTDYIHQLNLLDEQVNGTEGVGSAGSVSFNPTLNYVVGTIGWHDKLEAVNPADFPWNCPPDADEVAGTGTICNAGMQAAINWACDKGKALYLPGKFRIDSFELVVRKPLKIFGCGAGAGYGGMTLLGYEMRSGFVFTGAVTKRVHTRVLYRGSAADPQDAPMGVGLNIQAEFCSLSDFSLYLWFQRPTTATTAFAEKTNYGADYDIGLLNGCRVHLSMSNMHIMGYYREACFWHDSTRGANLSEFKDPSGVPYEVGTVQHGSDGLTMYKCFFFGGKWGFRDEGPKPKPGLPFYGYRLTIGAQITVVGTPAVDSTLTLNGVVFTFVDSTPSGTEILIGATTEETAANIAYAAESYTVNAISGPSNPATRSATFYADGSVVGVYQRESMLAMTAGAGGSNPFSLTTTSGAITLSSAYVESITDPAPYYDARTAEDVGVSYTAQTDYRGVFGSSDVTAIACSFYGTDHHSYYRRNDAEEDVVGQPLAYTTSSAGGAVRISGMAGNGSRKGQGKRFFSCRFASWEPFRIFIDWAHRVYFEGCHSESRTSSSVKKANSTSSTTNYVEFKDTDTFGPIALTDKAQNIGLIWFSANLRDKFIPSTIRFTNIAAAGSREVTRFTDVIRTSAHFESGYGLRSTVGELDLRTKDNTRLARIRGGSTTYLTIGSGGINFGNSISSPYIISSVGDLDLRSPSDGFVRMRVGDTSKLLVGSSDVRFVDGTIRLGGSSGPVIKQGSGTPEGVVTATMGSLFLRADTGDWYQKKTGSGNTGWILK